MNASRSLSLRFDEWARRWVGAVSGGLSATPDQEAALRAHQRETGVRNWRLIMLGSGLSTILWWPTDVLFSTTDRGGRAWRLPPN